MFGRPTSLTPELGTTLVECARVGMLLQGCADRAGVTRYTLDNWLKRGQDASEQLEQGQPVPDTEHAYVDLFSAFKKARGDREAEAHVKIRNGEEHWQAQAWWLERTMPMEYGRRFVRMEMTGKDGGPIEVAEFSDAERVRRFRALCELVPAGE